MNQRKINSITKHQSGGDDYDDDDDGNYNQSNQ